MSNINNFGVTISGEWKLTEYTIHTSPTQTRTNTRSIFFRQDNTFSFSSMTATSEGKWRSLGSMVVWQFDKPSALTVLPNIYMGHIAGSVMSGLKWIFITPSFFTEKEGYWNATKV